MRIAVLLKTHLWSKELEEYVLALQKDCLKGEVDLWLLMQWDGLEEVVVCPELENCCLRYRVAEIEKLYPSGFHGIWLSNHWIMMWFYQSHPDYDRYWSCEYDVRITGPTHLLWTLDQPHDFLYPVGGFASPLQRFRELYQGKGEIEAFSGMLQIARYSSGALAYLDDCYRQGENGQDEMITFSLIRRAGLTEDRMLLQSLIAGTWTWDSRYSDHNRLIYSRYLDRPEVKIFHPVKPILDV